MSRVGSKRNAAGREGYRKMPPPDAAKVGCGGGMVQRVKRIATPRKGGVHTQRLTIAPRPPPPRTGQLPQLSDFLQLGLQGQADASLRARRWLPGTLAQWFPRSDAAGAPAYYSVRAMQFVLQMLLSRGEGPLKVPAVRKFVHTFCASLDDAAATSVHTMYTGLLWRTGEVSEQVYRQACASVLPPLRYNRPVLLQAGYVGTRWAHTISLYFAPSGADRVYWAVIDRADDASEFHPIDAQGRAQPLVFCTSRTALLGVAAQTALQAVIALNDSDGPNTIEDFHARIAALVKHSDSRVAIGKNIALRIALPGQRGQKAGTCTLHSLFGALHLAMHHHFGTLDLQAPQARRTHVQALYKTMKLHCRSVMFAQLNAAVRHAEKIGDNGAATTLREVLDGATGYLHERLGKPHKYAADVLAAGAAKTASRPPIQQSQQAAASALH